MSGAPGAPGLASAPRDGFAGSLPCGRWSVWRYHWLPRHRMILALERVRRHAHGTLLDVGCGGRAFAPLFRGHADRYLGLDLPASPERHGPAPDVFGDALRLPVRDGGVDTVLCLSVLNLVDDPPRALAEMRRVLAPGGVAVIEFVQIAPLYRPCPDRWRFTRPGLDRLLGQAGLAPVEILALGRIPMFVGLVALDALNRLNRGTRRVLTELPVRVLYVAVQSGAAALDHLCARSGDVVAHLVVARARS